MGVAIRIFRNGKFKTVVAEEEVAVVIQAHELVTERVVRIINTDRLTESKEVVFPDADAVTKTAIIRTV